MMAELLRRKARPILSHENWETMHPSKRYDHLRLNRRDYVVNLRQKHRRKSGRAGRRGSESRLRRIIGDRLRFDRARLGATFIRFARKCPDLA